MQRHATYISIPTFGLAFVYLGIWIESGMCPIGCEFILSSADGGRQSLKEVSSWHATSWV